MLLTVTQTSCGLVTNDYATDSQEGLVPNKLACSRLSVSDAGDIGISGERDPGEKGRGRESLKAFF